MHATMTDKLVLTFFGAPGFFDGAGQRIALPKQAFALALYLALSGHGPRTTRTDAAHFLWPDSAGALTNLRQLFTRIRSVREADGLFDITATHIALQTENIWCDLIELQRLVVAANFDNAEKVLDLYGTGLFADAPWDQDGPADWISGQAASIRGVVVAVLSDLLVHADFETAGLAVKKIAARLLTIDAHEETAWQALMKAYAATGQIGLVRQTFEQCRFVLRRDLDITPTNETLALFRLLTSQQDASGRTVSSIVGDVQANTNVAAKGLVTALPRLVVLPPAGCSLDDPAFTAAGLLLEDIVVGLSSLKSVSIVAPHSSWRTKQGLIDDDVTIDRFQIGYILETSFLGTIGGGRLTTKLFDTASRTVLWADSFVLPSEQSESCCRDIAVKIILALADGIERTELVRYETQDQQTAYHWHLIGQKYLRQLDLPDVRRASKAFRRAIEADPDFAPAHSGRARTLQREWLLLGRGETVLLNGAEASGRQATTLDPRDARGFWELGLCNLYMWRFDDSLAYYDQAEKLAPQHADIIADYGDALAHAGRPEDGLEKIERAIELNPTPPEQYWWNAAGMYFQLGEYRKAIEFADKMAHPLPGLRVTAASWALLGDKKNAERCVTDFLENYPDFRIDKWLALVPNRNPDDTRHYEAGLRAAGFN